jgi:hypothetical protein
MMRLRSRLIPPVVASLALFVHATLMYKAALHHTEGVVSYPVDDAFIHLALAKQLALHGVYGVSPQQFTAASSSIGWPFVLAFAILLAGAKAWLPLALNAIFAVALLFAVDRLVLRLAPAASVVSRTLVCLAVMVLTPMATLVILGMEHTAHAAANIAFLASAILWLVDDAPDARTSLRRVLSVAAWAGATTLWRYEGMFPVAIVVALALARRRLRPALLVAVGGALPIVLFGIYSKAHGAHFLPTPVLLKGRHFDLTDVSAYFDLFGGDLLDRFGTESYALAIAVAIAGLAFYLVRRDGFWTANVLALLVTLGTVILHLELASVGWFFRYESYLLATGVAVIGATLARLLPSPRELWRIARAEKVRVLAGVVGIVILSAPVWRRAIAANNNTPQACRNIYEQQMQTARFLAAQFPNQRVAVNDIGAVAWLDNGDVVDLVGLATLAVAEAKHLKLDTAMSREDFVRLTAGVQVAVIYDDWFKENNLPSTWLRVARWTIRDNKSCAFPTVAIYATDPERYPEVIEAVRAFQPKLPQVAPVTTLSTTSTSAPEIAWSSRRARPRCRALTSSSAMATSSCAASAPSSPAGSPPTTPSPSCRCASTSCPARSAARRSSVSRASLEGKSAAAHAWIWREQPGAKNGFTKLTRAELGDGALLDGDIVVVP